VSVRGARFLRVARRVAATLGFEDSLLVGGLAVVAHGFVRATRDVDVLTRLGLSEARVRLARGGLPTRLLRGDPLEGGFPCLKGTCEGLPFDVLPQLVPIHWEQACAVEGSAARGLRAVALEDLLALKLKAQGAKDLMDVAMLVLLHPETEERARELATAYRVLDRFEMWLNDPRLRAQAREEAALERRRARRLPKRHRAVTRAPRRRRRRAPRRKR
jgi:hypothetical protein